jgi:hypothetical protein
MNVVVNVVQDFDIRLNMQIMRSYILLREQNKDNKSQKSKIKKEDLLPSQQNKKKDIARILEQ